MDSNTEIEKYRITSSKDIYEKLHHFNVEDKNQIIKLVNEYINTHRIKTPVIRIHNSDVVDKVYSNYISNSLARHYTDMYIVDFPHTEIDENFTRNLVRIVIPRLTEKGLIILKQENGIKVWRKNVRYSLNPQLFEVTF